MENEDLYRNLVILLKMFKNRPYHLTKYLIENSAFTEDFIKKISENDKLSNISEEDENTPKQPIYFLDIGKMNEHYSSFTDEIKLLERGKTPKELELDLNEKLKKFIFEEKYEDAARVRDYMVKNKIKRIK
jgi:hypothetical protein